MAAVLETSRRPAFNPFQFDRVSTAPFILKLFSLVDDPKNSLVTWTPDGKGFVVKDREVFERRHMIGLLADFPHKCKYSSFVRELNSYKFSVVQSIENGDPHDVFSVEGFERGNPKGLGGLRRKGNYGRFRRDETRVKTVSRLRGDEMFGN